MRVCELRANIVHALVPKVFQAPGRDLYRKGNIMKFKRLDLSLQECHYIQTLVSHQLKERYDLLVHAHSHGSVDYIDVSISVYGDILAKIEMASVIETPDD